jgi:glycine oxidase
VQTWDTIIVGGGIIGLSLALGLRRRGQKVLVVERGEPGREASHAAGGMLADHGDEFPAALKPLAVASARMYPEFAHELQDESGIQVDLRDDGTILLHDDGRANSLPKALSELEPELSGWDKTASYLEERSVDPRALVAAALKAARHREVDISSGSEVTEITVLAGRVNGVKTARSHYHAAAVVNCAGAWAGQFPALGFPTRPVKGQILSVVGGPKLRHVVRAPGTYLIPRTDGRLVIGATAEDAGFDKRTDAGTIQRLIRAAERLAPGIQKAQLHEAWAGLRPGTPDKLPILGETGTPGYFAATGHFRDGILLAPVTGEAMAELIVSGKTSRDLSAFSPARFETPGTLDAFVPAAS